jgi:hypothetical protein
VNYASFATTAFGNTPSPAAPARAVLALRAPARARAITAPAPRGLDAPVARRTQTAPSAPPVVARSPQSRTMAAAPRHLSAARAQVWQRRIQVRTAALATAAQRHTAVTAALAQVAAARAALEQVRQQRQAQHESRLEAKAARRAAARALSPRTHGARQ